MVEFSLILPLMLFVILGVIEAGRLVFLYASVTNAAREGARYGSAIGSGGTQYLDCTGITDAAQSMSVLEPLDMINISYDTGNVDDTIADCDTISAGMIEGGLHRVTVQTQMSYQPIVPFPIMPNLTLTSRSSRTIAKALDIDLIPPSALITPMPTLSVPLDLAVMVDPESTGTGKITSDPAGIDCSSDCVEYYEFDTSITLSAEADTGSNFSSWSGDGCSGSGTCTLTMDEPKSVAATFLINTYTMTYSAGEGGSIDGVSPQQVNHGENGSQVEAVADTGYSFDRWSDGLTVNPRTDTAVTADTDVTAIFVINTYTLDVTTEGAGKVTSSPTGIDCGYICTHTYDYNTSVTLTATTGPGSTFSGWFGAGCSGTGTCTLSMDAAKSVTAIFEYKLTVVVEPSDGGTTTPAVGVHTYPQGMHVNVYAVPADGYIFDSWSGACDGNDPDDCQVTMNDEKVVKAHFHVDPYPPPAP